MSTLLRIFVVSYTLPGLVNGQSHYSFEKPLATPGITGILLSQHKKVPSKMRCAVLCSSTLPCDRIQYCEHDDLCALYAWCAHCPTNFISCTGGIQPVTAVLTDPSSRTADHCAFGGYCLQNKYLVTGADGVADDQLSASTFFTMNDQELAARNARLNSSHPEGSWSSGVKDTNQFVQVDFRRIRLMTGVVLMGRAPPANFQYVTTFKLLYSLDCVSFNHTLGELGVAKIFAGCSSIDEPVVTHCFYPPIPTRCVRINPITWDQYPSLRFDILGY